MKTIYFYLIRTYRIIAGSIVAFSQNNDYLKASALTFYTLISIVPFLAVAFGIATGFGFEEYLQKQLTHSFEEQPEMISYAIRFAHSLLQNTKGSLIAGIGLIALFWTNLSMLGSIESALNDIWRVKTPRTWAKKVIDYLAAMILCPIFFVVSSSVSVFLITEITETAKENRLLELMSPFLLFLFKLAPFFLSILLFVVVYLFIPNAKIQTRPRIIAGVIAGIAFQLWQWAYIHFQVSISQYGAVYGTFAALPLFLIWLQVSWLIFLAGAELAAHIENEMAYTKLQLPEELCTITQKELGLLILCRCIEAFHKGEFPLTALMIAQDLGIAVLQVQKMIDILEDGGIIVEAGTGGGGKVGYQPRMDARLFTIKNVCDAIEKHVGWSVEAENSTTLQKISQSLKEFDALLDSSPANLAISDLISLMNTPKSNQSNL